MNIWKRLIDKFFAFFFPPTLAQGPLPLIVESAQLGRPVFSHLYLPDNQVENWSLLLINDGQDESRLALKTLHQSFRSRPTNLMIVAIHAGDRMAEYGTAQITDYKGRGKKSDAYQAFIIKELLPQLRTSYPISVAPERVGIAGFSLGALSAADIAWRYPEIFGFAGVFSGALWWRKAPFRQEDPDADRIIHEKMIEGKYRDQRFWFQAGTLDEIEDRNNNGVIDAIDDTLHLINILKHRIPNDEHHLKYVEVAGGKHDPDTWRTVFPEFLDWAFGN